MIVSKITTINGHSFIGVEFNKKSHEADVLFFSQHHDFNNFEADTLEQFDGMPLKNYRGEPLVKGCTTVLTENCYGENTNLLTIAEMKKVAREINHVVDWLIGLGYTVTFSPWDARRLTATKRILKSRSFSVSEIEEGFKVTLN